MATELRVRRFSTRATLPYRATPGSVGYELCAAEAVLIKGRGRRCAVSTDLCIAPPPGTYIRIAPKSSLSASGIDIGAGVVDPDYRGKIKVVVINNSKEPFNIMVGTRIAQAVIERIETPDVVEVDGDELDETERGSGGFGSTSVPPPAPTPTRGRSRKRKSSSVN